MLRSATDRATTVAAAGASIVFGVNPFSSRGQPESGPGYVRCVSAADGAVLWEREQANGLGRPVVDRGTV